jgi:hypothetical protein
VQKMKLSARFTTRSLQMTHHQLGRSVRVNLRPMSLLGKNTLQRAPLTPPARASHAKKRYNAPLTPKNTLQRALAGDMLAADRLY